MQSNDEKEIEDWKKCIKTQKKICVVKQNDFEDLASLHLNKIQSL